MLQPRIDGAGIAHGPRKTLKEGFNFVMTRTPVHDLEMQIGFGVLNKAFEKIRQELNDQIPNPGCADLVIINESSTAPEIDRADGQRFIHGKNEIASPIDAGSSSKCCGEKLSEDNARVFDSVMLIYLQIAVGLQLKIKRAVPREQFQHMIEESNAGRDLIIAVPLDHEPSTNLRFRRFPIDRGQRFITRSQSRLHLI